MIEDLDYLAAAHFLGVLEGVEAAQAQALMECDPQFRRAVSGWEERLIPLLETVAEEEPPADMWQRISAALDREPPVSGHPESDRSWTLLEPGVQLKILRENQATGERSALVKMDPGSVIGAHEHDREEVCVVLQGSVVIDNLTYEAGATHTAPAGSIHRSVNSAQGAIMLLHWAAKAA